VDLLEDNPICARSAHGESMSTIPVLTDLAGVGEGVPGHGRGDAVTRWLHAAAHQRASQTRTNAVRSIVSASASSSNNLRTATPGRRLVNIGPLYDERRTRYASGVTGTCPVDYRSESLKDRRRNLGIAARPLHGRGG
jgi:hypothetical protein